MAELGYQRSSKKCKEKFENVYKYHKRTKEGRASKADGKTYRFFDQLEALESNPSALQLPPTPTPRPPPLAAAAAAAVAAVQMPQAASNAPMSSSHTVSSAPLSPNPVSFAQNLVPQNVANPNIPTLPSLQPAPTTNAMNPPPLQSSHSHSHHHYPTSHANIMAGMLSNSSSSSTSSDEEIGRRHGRKRKWKDFFERLMKDVIVKQEELQKKFLESLEKRERDRMIREEAWRVQEMARMNREHDLLVQERSMAAAKDAAVIAFLQKITDQQNQQNPNGSSNAIQLPVQLQIPNNPSLSSPPAVPLQAPPASTAVAPPPISIPIPCQTIVPVSIPTAAAATPSSQAIQAATRNVEITPKTTTTDNGIQNFSQPSPSRWPKSEVQALIKLRTNLDMKYQETGPKGPLWEEISSGMRKLGYNRNSKRCKEKWENINKYFKKVKESNKKRPDDSKTCPYFHQLDALYKEKAKFDTGSYNFGGASTNVVKPENPMVPIMARPEQQWPIQQENQHQQQQQQQQPQQQQQQQQQDSAMEDHESENMDENDHDDDGDDDDEEDEGGGYEIVTNKQPSSVSTTVE